MPDDDSLAWAVDWTGEARRSLRHIPPRILPAVITFVEERLATNPKRATHTLDAPLDDCRSGGVGPFRVLVKLDEDAHVVHIVKAAYHADVYRPR
jgi:mRNA-degrading endonuclease RelE of RelBE toxin-antitoxin system